MKKLLLTLVALVAAMSMSAQVITVMKDGKLVQAFDASQANEVYFGEFQQREFVDLGLSVFWATTNIGATQPQGYGDYFSWAEIETYYTAGHSTDNPCSSWKSGKSNGYAYASNQYYNTSTSEFTKYNATDGKTELDKEDDAATANWGSQWRMPTQAEFQELIDNCTWTWVTNYNNSGVKGYKVTSKKSGYTDKYIFLPAAGWRGNKDLQLAGNQGDYWASTLNSEQKISGMDLYFETNAPTSVIVKRNYRFYGFPIRAVMDKPNQD